MIDFTAQEDAIKQWALLGSGLAQTQFENGPRDQLQAAYVDLKYLTSRREGADYVELVPAGTPTDRTVPRVTCTRLLDVLVAIESEDQTAALFSLAYLETLRAMSEIDTVTAPLGEAGLVLVDLQDPSNEDAQRDERWISRFALLATFRWQFQITIDNEANAGSWIEKAQGEGTFKRGDDATPVDGSMSVDIHPED